MSSDLPDALLGDETEGGAPMAPAGPAVIEDRPATGPLATHAGDAAAPTTEDAGGAALPEALVDPPGPHAGGLSAAAHAVVTGEGVRVVIASLIGPGGDPSAATSALPPPAPVYVPRPRPPIRPERTAEGHYRTDGILLERAAGRSCYITIFPPQAAPQRIYVQAHAFDKLLALATTLNWDQGRLWRALSDIPLERPLPSRRLEEELKALLSTFAADLRD